MSVREALRMKQNKEFAEHVKALLREKGITGSEFAALVLPDDVKGRWRVRDALTGSLRPRSGTVRQWAELLGVPYDDLAAKQGPPIRATKPGTSNGAWHPAAPPASPEVTTNTFELVIDNNMKASVRMNMANVSISAAMLLVDALRGTGLFTTEARTRQPDNLKPELDTPWQPHISQED